jgi:hypothetical protein
MIVLINDRNDVFDNENTNGCDDDDDDDYDDDVDDDKNGR